MTTALNSSNIFAMSVNGKDYSFDLGPSTPAREACRGLDLYKTTAKYGDLRRLFAELSWIVSKGNPSNREACKATRILALSVFPTLNDNYQKLFVANSVTSIYAKAGYPIPKDWVSAQNQYMGIIAKNNDPESALEAGLVYIDMIPGETSSKPIPKYSA